MKKHKRYHNQIKDDKQKEYDEMESSQADMTDFRRPAYAVKRAIRVQGEQIREGPCVNRKHSAWIEDADQIAESKYGIRGDADGSGKTEQAQEE